MAKRPQFFYQFRVKGYSGFFSLEASPARSELSHTVVVQLVWRSPLESRTYAYFAGTSEMSILDHVQRYVTEFIGHLDTGFERMAA